MMNYDIPQTLGVSSSTSSNNNPHRVSPHSYYQQSHHLHQPHHRLKNEPFSPPISSHSTNNTRSSLNDNNHSPTKTPILQQQRSADYGSSPPCSEPSLKHARFDSSIWPNPT